MKRISHLLPIAIIILISLNAPADGIDEDDKFDYSKNVGVVYFLGAADRPLLEIQTETLNIGDTINIVLIGVGGEQRILKAVIASGPIIDFKRTRVSIVESQPPVLYELKPHIDVIWDKGTIGIAIAGEHVELKTGDEAVYADLEPDGVFEFFRGCTSNEGSHYTVWSKTPLEGTRRWHAYYYIGYDVEPNCTDKDYLK